MTETENSTSPIDFLVQKSDLYQQAFKPSDLNIKTTPAKGQLLLRVDQFALTANNITYALFGDAMDYWQFFPAEQPNGRVPVWGFAEVIASAVDSIAVGERVYGFLPISSHLLVEPTDINPGGFVDGAAHRQKLHALYNQYSRVAGDPSYNPNIEAEQMILRPLFMTSFLIEDFLRDNDYFGASRLILTSASSKTAIGIAHQVAHAAVRPTELVALTSAGNREFVHALGLYDSIVSYDEIESLASDVPTAYVDMAGNNRIRRELHEHLGDHLNYACAVGVSHWDENAAPEALPGPKPVFFFAPAQFQERAAELGPATVLSQFGKDWTDFVETSRSWLQIERQSGTTAIQATFNDMLRGDAAPDRGYILSFQ